MYKIPDEIRGELRKVIGILVKDEKELLSELRGRSFVISVGDMVTYTLLSNGFEPNIAVVDFRHRRRKVSQDMEERIKKFGEEVIHVKNPPSIISDELIDSLRFAYSMSKEKKVLIVVEGEEDLASLVAILLAPEGATVIYGLPDKGIVLVEVTDKEKEVVRRTLERCMEHGAGDNRKEGESSVK